MRPSQILSVLRRHKPYSRCGGNHRRRRRQDQGGSGRDEHDAGPSAGLASPAQVGGGNFSVVGVAPTRDQMTVGTGLTAQMDSRSPSSPGRLCPTYGITTGRTRITSARQSRAAKWTRPNKIPPILPRRILPTSKAGATSYPATLVPASNWCRQWRIPQRSKQSPKRITPAAGKRRL
jgi:hypothetical protein